MLSPQQKKPFPSDERRGLRAYRYALAKGLLLRPLGNVLYLMPPYVISAKELEHACAVLAEAVEHACA
jgi:adenosylmethionine-8-amino-7-oxononanoate aminotransferase